MSKLDGYITKLLSSDDALKAFLVDPIKAAEDEHGLTKGQRSVLRRVVANLSNNSTNGYGIVRHLDSYRRSIRLLQNVLHLERGHALNQHVQAQATKDDQDSNLEVYTIYIYYNGIPSEPGVNSPYAYSMHYNAAVTPGSTLGDIMAQATDYYYNKLADNMTTSTINGVEVVTSFTIPNNAGYFFPGVYKAAPQAVTTHTPFWFFSLGGMAITNDYINNSAYMGDASQGFKDVVPSYYLPQGGNNNTIYWQAIAPDVAYGFAPCDTSTVENTFTH